MTQSQGSGLGSIYGLHKMCFGQLNTGARASVIWFAAVIRSIMFSWTNSFNCAILAILSTAAYGCDSSEYGYTRYIMRTS